MKKLLLCAVCVVLCVTPVQAERKVTFGDASRVAEFNVPFSEMMTIHGGGPRKMPRQADLSSETTEPIFVFPVVGNAAGANGTHFRSETTIVNNLNRPQRIAMFYFPAAGSGGNANNCNLNGIGTLLDPLEWLAFSDFVGTVFNATGLGSVIVMGVDANNNLDNNARLDGMSRIYTPVPGTGGQASQSFPGVSINVAPGATLYAYGLRQDAAFRTNIGVFNYDFLRQLRRTFDMAINGSNGAVTFSVDVDPCNLVQFRAPTGDFGIFELSGRARDGGALWYGYGSSNDNQTGDNWSSVLH